LSEGRHIALFLYGPMDGGAPRRTLTLAHEFALRGHRVDLVMVRGDGPIAGQISARVRVVLLETRLARLPGMVRRLQIPLSVWALSRYLRRERPDVLLAAANSVHVAALLAHRLAGVETRLALRVASHVGALTDNEVRRTRPLIPVITRRLYPWADLLIAVSRDVADDLADLMQVPRSRIPSLPNPVVSRELPALAQAPCPHPWLAPNEPPVVLGAGRFVIQKDFPALIRAFAKVRAERALRLIILGEGKFPARRARLEELAHDLGVASDMALPGLVDNPFAYMSRAGVFVLSSAWEGLPGVLIEAMACGCPVASTDCPGGSREILEGGRCGPLFPIGDVDAMASAIRDLLDRPPDPALLEERAAAFGVGEAAARYLDLLLPESGSEVAT